MINLPDIPHAKVWASEFGTIGIKMDDGYFFIEEGEYPEDTPIEDIPKGISGMFTPDTDFSRFIVKTFNEEV